MLKVSHISKTFFPGTPNEVCALSDVSVEIPQESFTAIIGTNGSGKSTLLNAIAGTFFPDEGSLLLDGQNITGWIESKRASLIGRVFQNPFAGTAADMTIAENIVLAMRRGQSRPLRAALSRSAKDAMADRIRTLKMGLEDRLDNPIGTLSGGQRQALTLLMATWIKPKLLLLDEHTAALDPKSAAKIAELTTDIIRNEKITAIMVTHSMQQAIDMPDRIVMMHKGQIIEEFRDDAMKRIRIPDLIEIFNRVQKRDMFDESAADLMREQFV